MLATLRVSRRLTFTRPGTLNPFLGPALRGILGWQFKSDTCRYPLPSWPRTCEGCPHQSGCGYGQTVEPDVPAARVRFRGQEKGCRPLVLAMPFPMPTRVRPGQTSTITVTLIGPGAIAQEGALWRALRAAGADARRGFDPQRTTFELLDPPLEEVREEAPALPSGPGDESIPRLRIELSSPLFLREEREDGKKRWLTRPNFADILRASLRTLGGLYGLHGTALEADFRALKEAALAVRTLRSDLHSFEHWHTSNRSGQTRPTLGATGSAEFGPVPLGLLPWLEWGGRLHVGTDRVAGAGGWSIVR